MHFSLFITVRELHVVCECNSRVDVVYKARQTYPHEQGVEMCFCTFEKNEGLLISAEKTICH